MRVHGIPSVTVLSKVPTHTPVRGVSVMSHRRSALHPILQTGSQTALANGGLTRGALSGGSPSDARPASARSSSEAASPSGPPSGAMSPEMSRPASAVAPADPIGARASSLAGDTPASCEPALTPVSRAAALGPRFPLPPWPPPPAVPAWPPLPAVPAAPSTTGKVGSPEGPPKRHELAMSAATSVAARGHCPHRCLQAVSSGR